MIKDSNATPPALLPVAVARMTGIGEPPGAFNSLSISGRVKRQPRMKTKPERIATGIPITIALGIYQVVRIESTSSFEFFDAYLLGRDSNFFRHGRDETNTTHDEAAW